MSKTKPIADEERAQWLRSVRQGGSTYRQFAKFQQQLKDLSMSQDKTITDEERAQWRAEEEAATEGPWGIEETYVDEWGDTWRRINSYVDTSHEAAMCEVGDCNHEGEADAKLIVTMRNNWRRLLDENERLREEVEKWRDANPIAGHNARVAEQRRADAFVNDLHPNGRCTCAGEGACGWCLSATEVE